MATRRLTFEERREQLVGALNMLINALDHYEAHAQIYSLRAVAQQLYTMLRKGANSHPLLIELARERSFPLTIYQTDSAYTEKVMNIGPQPPIFYSKGDSIALDSDELRSVATTIDVALKTMHTTVMGQDYTLEQIFLLVADKEARHYDLDRPLILDDLDCVQLGGLPAHYRVVYDMGRVVRDLCARFLQATA